MALAARVGRVGTVSVLPVVTSITQSMLLVTAFADLIHS